MNCYNQFFVSYMYKMSNTEVPVSFHETSTQRIYWMTWLYIITIVVVLIGGINWGLVGLFDYNVIGQFTGPSVSKIIYILVGVVSVSLLINRNTYLPFLGNTAYPCGSLVDKIPDQATTTVTVRVPPQVKVVYWASEPAMDVASDPWTAYARYENTGVVTANAEGQAILKFREPSQYHVQFRRHPLPKHVHYRYCQIPGLLSEVYTVEVTTPDTSSR